MIPADSSENHQGVPGRSLDERPKTAVLQQFAGIGDFVWHIPYFREAAKQSRGGQVAVIANPSTYARDLLMMEPWVGEVIYFEQRVRRTEKRKAKHAGLAGLWRMARELRERQFDRILLFTPKLNRAILAWLAGIPHRHGFGFGATQRLLLTGKPYIKPYKGRAVAIQRHAVAFAQALGLCVEPIVPRITVAPEALETMRAALAHLPKPFYTFSVGSSEPQKQWGGDNFAQLAALIAERGCGVLLVGGPNDEAFCKNIMAKIPGKFHASVDRITNRLLMESAAALALSAGCMGNDTGILNMAAACARPCYAVIGPRPLLDHDPLIHNIVAPVLAEISPAQVFDCLREF